MEILSSIEYDKFKLLPCNRPISQAHVDTLVNDRTFSKSHPFYPGVVDEEFFILDGQHRFHAAKALGIPFCYIIQRGPAELHIGQTSCQVLKWTAKDYVHFNKMLGKASYILFGELCEKYSCAYWLMQVICYTIDKADGAAWRRTFKVGEMVIRHPVLVKQFCEEFLPVLKEVEKVHGRKEVQIIYTNKYFVAAIHLWRDEYNTFLRLMEKLPMHFRRLAIPRDVADATVMLKRIADARGIR